MNFDLDEHQQVVRDLAAQIFTGSATTDRVRDAENGDGFDHLLWSELAGANLLGLCLPEDFGGSGMGVLELALIAEQQGRHVAPVPLVPTVTSAMALAEFALDGLARELLPGVIDGTRVLTSALAESGANDPLHPRARASTQAGGTVRITGFKPSVPWAQHASHALVPVVDDSGSVVVAVVDLSEAGVELAPVRTTNHEPQAHLTLDTVVSADCVLAAPDLIGWLFDRALIGLCAVQVGVCAGSLALTAEHVSAREQFGKPLAAMQAVRQRAADGYILTEALRYTALNAAWRVGESLDARRDVLVAAYWSGEGAQKVVLGSQHLHGGIGADVDYPVHRYFLWGMQLATALGSSSAHLARLGQLIKNGVSH